MRTLVTGGTGFIGKHLVDALGEQCEVETFGGDITDPAAFDAVAPADTLVHLAAQSQVPKSMADPRGTWRVNVDGTLNALDWARRVDAGRFVFISTGHVYGPPRYSPINEKHPTLPVSPYGASKLAAEAAVRAYGATYGFETVIVRPFNVYGPGQTRGFLIPDILYQILDGKRLVLGDPRPIRDFTYVSDAIALLVEAATRPGIDGTVVNLGSGEGHAVSEVIATALEVSGSSLQPEHDESKFRPLDTPELVVENRVAHERLGWRAVVGLREGLARTWKALEASQ